MTLMTLIISNTAQMRVFLAGHPTQKHDPQFDPPITHTFLGFDNVRVICGSNAGHLAIGMTRTIWT